MCDKNGSPVPKRALIIEWQYIPLCQDVYCFSPYRLVCPRRMNVEDSLSLLATGTSVVLSCSPMLQDVPGAYNTRTP